MSATLEDYRWLTSPAAEPWLRRCAEDDAPPHARAAALRRALSPARTHLVLEQVELRGRGRQKFGRAAEMFFTRVGLEQATDEIVAAYKARRMPRDRVADLCCGVGGDLLALAARGGAVGVERDPIVACLAEANCRLVEAGRGGAREVRTGDAAAFPVENFIAWHIDPDRRPQGRRTTRVELHEPSDAALERLLGRHSSAAIKLAPAAVLPPDWSKRAELEWIGRAGQCRQLVAWFGSLTDIAGGRRATILGATAEPTCTFVGRPDVPIPTATEIGPYLFEPDPAARAAHLTGALAAEHNLAAAASDAAYLTGPKPLDHPALTCFEVIDVLPFQIKRLKQLLRARGVGRLEIKKRGVPQRPEQLRKQLAVPGENAATLLLARTARGVTAILARRVA